MTFFGPLGLCDGILVASNDLHAIQHTDASLYQHFKLKDLGSVKYFLGMEVARSKNVIFLC